MSDGRDMNDDSGLAFDHAGKESTVQANGGEQVDLQYSLPVLVGEHLESAWSCFCSTDIVHQYVEPTPLLLNAIDDVLDTACIASEGRATTIPEIVAKAKPAVVQIITSEANRSPIKTGTGFFRKR